MTLNTGSMPVGSVGRRSRRCSTATAARTGIPPPRPERTTTSRPGTSAGSLFGFCRRWFQGKRRIAFARIVGGSCAPRANIACGAIAGSAASGLADRPKS